MLFVCLFVCLCVRPYLILHYHILHVDTSHSAAEALTPTVPMEIRSCFLSRLNERRDRWKDCVGVGSVQPGVRGAAL